MNMLAIVISLLCAGFVLFQRHFFGLPGQSREKQSKPGTSRSEPPHAKSLVPSSEILVSKSYRSGLERTGADIGTAPAGGDAIFAPVSEEKSAMQGWNTLVVQPPIGEDGELAEPEAPDAPPARPQLPALPADHAAHADDILLQRFFCGRLHDRPCFLHPFLCLLRILLQKRGFPLEHGLRDLFIFLFAVL